MSGVSTPLKCNIQNKNYALRNKRVNLKRRSLNSSAFRWLSSRRIAFSLNWETPESNFLTSKENELLKYPQMVSLMYNYLVN